LESPVEPCNDQSQSGLGQSLAALDNVREELCLIDPNHIIIKVKPAINDISLDARACYTFDPNPKEIKGYKHLLIMSGYHIWREIRRPPLVIVL
jgi:hypothetical protein